jgi:hypothetical protein
VDHKGQVVGWSAPSNTQGGSPARTRRTLDKREPTSGSCRRMALERSNLFSNERFEEWGASFSPDSRWMAFVSTESGSPEVYVAPVQEPGKRTRISNGGGVTPRWRRDGRELFYASADNRAIIAVPIAPGPTFAAGSPTRLFSVGASPAARGLRRNAVYDASPDGERFLVSLSANEPSSSRITVVLNWTAVFGR